MVERNYMLLVIQGICWACPMAARVAGAGCAIVACRKSFRLRSRISWMNVSAAAVSSKGPCSESSSPYGMSACLVRRRWTRRSLRGRR
jgi:hypothetical protein